VTTGFFIVHGEALSRLASAYHPLATVSAVLATLVALGAGAPWLRETVTRTLLRRRRREAQDLQAALHALSPELGVVECARQALAALTRIRQLPGAAILFVDGEALIHGRFRLEPLLRAWPRGEEAARLPRGVYDSLELRELKLAMREALVESNVGLGVAAIDSPRRRWGHLFLQAGFLGGSFRIDDVDQFAAFVDQLALRLDAADLLARALAVERSLAHAEKLAAIGELAARFAHDIRNPVTAARSLAQQLARDPTAPANAEHAGIILAELERVERRVRDLLRFARREELRVEPTEVGALVRAAVEPFASRCAAGGVTLAVEAPEPVVVPVDAEKLRLALANLIENALDAVAGAAAKRVAIAVGRANGRATVRVSDSGPGVPDDALPHLFEPFYSRKSHGTGLGLAIAKRTVDAHGGAIAAHQPPGEGLTFTIELPLHAPG
jgi:signal transduction histidine kinase